MDRPNIEDDRILEGRREERVGKWAAGPAEFKLGSTPDGHIQRLSPLYHSEDVI